MIEKALIIGWDGATWDYIDPMLAQGKMPHLAKLLTNGSRAMLKSTIPPFTNIAWPSMVTGLAPNKTGIFDGARTAPHSYKAVPTNLVGYKGIPIWDWLNKHGYRTGILNVPMTYPASAVDGYLVSGFDSPLDSPEVAYPHDIFREWARAGKSYEVLAEEISLMSSQNPHHQRSDLVDFSQRWVDLTIAQGEHVAWLWHKRTVDFLFVVFSGTDSINHRTHDFDTITRVYQAADTALGQILSHVDKDTVICIVSDHGSTPAYRYLSLYRALSDGGWMQFRPQVAARFLNRIPGIVGKKTVAIWEWLPVWMLRLFSWPFLRLDKRLAVDYNNIDWEYTRASSRSGMGAIYLNRRENRPTGTVAQAEYETIREEIRHQLLELRDESGQPVFGSVLIGEEVYPNADPADDPPDLVVQPAQWSDHIISGFPTDPLVRPIPDNNEYGTHTPDGILVLSGPGIRADNDLTSAQITDVTPTLLALMGLPIPLNVDGQVLQEAVSFPVVPSYQEVELSSKTSTVYSQDEANEVLQRLEDLGYL